MSDLNIEACEATSNKPIQGEVPPDVSVGRVLAVWAEQRLGTMDLSERQWMTFPLHHRRQGVSCAG